MSKSSFTKNLSRRRLLQGAAAAGTALAFPHLWLPSAAHAQTAGRGAVKHLLYIRLNGGFRFTTAFNGDVAAEFNPFGSSGQKASGTEWGASSLLERAGWLEGEEGEARRKLGMKRVTEISNEICVLPCVDHEPFSGRADGNHGTGLERFFTGYVGGSTGFLSYVNWGLRERVAEARALGVTLLPAFSLGEAGMATGSGAFAAFRAPVLDGGGFERFGFDAESSLPAWASKIAANHDSRMAARVHSVHRASIEAYQQTRVETKTYGLIFNDPLLKVGERSDDQVDGISNRELETIFGTGGEGRRAALALRLFHFGCPAVFFNQGGYDLHSGEEGGLPGRVEELNRLLSGLHAALKRMRHPDGGTYWDKTLIVLGSEFGRSTGGQRFNSAGGSDHGSDFATRWMSMPMMGGVIAQAGKGGKRLGETRGSDLRATGQIYSYRAMLKTMMDLLGADHAGVFPADAPIQELFG